MATRFELLTPRGAGGIAVVAVAGGSRYADLERLLERADGTALDARACSRPRLARLTAGGDVIDEVLVCDRSVARVVELHLHASEAVLASLERAASFAVRARSPADELLENALGEPQLALALEQRGFAWAEFLDELRQLPPGPRAAAIDAARGRSVAALALAEPRPLVLCGRQNAGKSTLMNRLLLEERALAGELPGLTRDPVAELTTLADYPYRIVDTAGLGPASEGIDAAAQRRGTAVREGALSVAVIDGSRPIEPVDLELARTSTLVVRSKADLDPAPWPAEISSDATVRCLDPADATAVRRELGEALRVRRGLPVAGPAGGPAALTRQQLADLASLA